MKELWWYHVWKLEKFNLLKYLFFNFNYFSVFTAENGALMDIFEKDPVTFMLYHLSMEKFENGRQIVEKILELFDKEKPFAQQLETIEQVIDRKPYLNYSYLILTYYWAIELYFKNFFFIEQSRFSLMHIFSRPLTKRLIFMQSSTKNLLTITIMLIKAVYHWPAYSAYRVKWVKPSKYLLSSS